MDPARTAPSPGEARLLRRLLIVVNPVAGRGRGLRAAEELRSGLERRGIEVELISTSARGDAPGLLRSAGPADLVVAAGGDGTLGEVFEGLVDPRVPVGCLPCGTANVLASSLGLPSDVPRAIEILLHGRLQPIDVARVGAPGRPASRLSHLVVGVGLDAAVVRELEARRRGPIARWHFAPAALRALGRHRPPRLTVTVDGERLPGTSGQVLVANTAGYAGLLHLSSSARIDDGALEVYLFPEGSRRALAAAFLRGLVAHLPSGPVAMRRARVVRIESEEPVPYQVDGDLGGETPVVVELLPEPYRLVVP